MTYPFFRGETCLERKNKLPNHLQARLGLSPRATGSQAVPSRGREVNLTSGKWSGLPELPLGWVPGKPGAILTSQNHAMVSQHPAWPLGSLRGSQECGQKMGGPP